MGEFADDLYDRGMEEEDEFQELCDYYSKLNDKELKKTIIELLAWKSYRKNTYTELVTNIIKYDTFSEKQRKVLVLHLANYDYTDWMSEEY